MKFFMKMFKALNSAQTPWQVTLAMALGMVAGLTPVSGLQTVLILFLVFLLNIHLGLFLVASTFFAGVGYLFDPWFEQIGYILLTSDILKGFWTFCYNSGLLRMTYFNNTLALGSTVVALVLAGPLYFLLGWMIHRYRGVLATVLGKYPRLGLFGILKASDKKDPLLRWWGAGLFVSIAVLFAVLTLVVINPVMKWALESGGSRVLQRDLRVGDVDVNLTQGSIAIARLEVAGEQKNIDALSIAQAAFDLDLNALLLKRTHIETIAISGVGFNTPATLKKRVARSEVREKTAKSIAELSLPAVTLPTPESLLANADLKSIKAYDAAQKEIREVIERWQRVADTDLSTDSLAGLQNDFKRLSAKSDSKDPGELLELAGEVSAFVKKVKVQQEQIARLKESFATDQKRIEQLYRNMEQASAEDYKQLQSAYSLDGNGAMNVMSLLLSDKLKAYLDKAERYFTKVAPYLASEPKPPVPPRGEGRWMKFPLTGPTPNLWIATTEIDGIVNKQSFKASVRDISDNQRALGRPVRFRATSDGPQISKLVVEGEDNRLGETIVDTLTFASQGIQLEDLSVAPLQFKKSRMGFKGKIVVSDMSGLRGESTFAFTETDMGMQGGDKTGEIVSEILGSIKAFNADITLGGTFAKPQIGVRTDLDKQLAQGMTAGLGKQAEAYKSDLKGLLAKQSAGNIGALKGDAAGLVDINGLAKSQNQALGGLSGDAGALLDTGGVGGALKGLKLF
ncbi:MAG: TIGR03545 family protein [Spirochaetales bacterium]|jgi:uncharacterized protein (TIGR03545 family)/uncharacterized protein (TIGR03546 family)|nr:TIGR03545 family protein [Spirochaetales bacterium]